jgi:uncharacterized protein
VIGLTRGKPHPATVTGSSIPACNPVMRPCHDTFRNFKAISRLIPRWFHYNGTSRKRRIERKQGRRMTEDSNRQFVLDFLNTLYSGDVETTLARCTDDIEFLANAPVDLLPHLGHRRGKAELREMWNAVLARYSELRCEVPTLVADGDKVAAYIRVFFRKSLNQRMVQFDIAGFYTLRDGKVSQIREIIDTFDLVQQLVERDVSAILTGRRSTP